LQGEYLEIDKKSIKKMFPNLSRELDGKEGTVPIDSVRTDPDIAEKTVVDTETKISDKFHNYNPNAVDFIRRCDTTAQAEEIIAYLQKRGEITKEYACKLNEQLKKKGVRSFGPKKEEDYYFKHS
jgi:hypothetical protein